MGRRVDRRRAEPAQGLWWIVVAAATIAIFPGAVRALLAGPVARTWVTILISVSVQALPFLVLGVLVSSLLAAFLPAGLLARIVPRRTGLSVPVAGLAGAALPGCECSSVVVAGRLVASGVPPAAAVSFLLAAPAVNPVVLVATAVAFPGQPRFVLARFLASFLTAVAVGWAWDRFGSEPTTSTGWAAPGRGRDVFVGTFVEDFAASASFLVLGAAATATLQVGARPSLLASLGSGGWTGVPVLAVMAVAVCVCSEADAFVAATFTQFSPTARLAFMVVGPVVDLKLIALQSGTFGGAFTRRFAPLTFGVALAASVIVGAALL
jgi:uncharacterized membrane protein YraQ (UPF0718 family)